MTFQNKYSYYIISGLNLHDNNRGTAALSYGSFSFLNKYHKTEGLTAINFVFYKKPWKFKFKGENKEQVTICNNEILLQYIYIWFIDNWIYQHIPFLSRYTKMARVLKKVSFIAAINGGDGFSDIYGTNTFESRLVETNLAMRECIPLIILPQTLGPFKDESNLKKAEEILKYASKVYARDSKFGAELRRMDVPFEITKDLSYYMEPEKFDIEIQPNAVGLNVSGLCYSNKFRDLSGRFDNYPILIELIIKYFQERNVPIYLVSHSYNYETAEETNDDLEASRKVFEKLKNKTNVHLIDGDLTSPQTKYVISKFDFFIGSRMHANFAAIYTKVPVFGLAYSYKFEGAFDSCSLNDSHAMVIDLSQEMLQPIIEKIMNCYVNRDEIKVRIEKLLQ